MAIGLVLMVVVMATDHRWVRIVAPVFYLGSIVGLGLVLVAGSTINGSVVAPARRDVDQPVRVRQAVGGGRHGPAGGGADGGRWRRGVRSTEFVGMLAIAGVPAALIMLQPDLGTLLVLSAIVFGVLAVSGADRRWLAGLTVTGVAGAASRSASGCSRTTRSTASWRSPTPASIRAEPATTPSRRGSPSATVASSARGSSTAPKTRSGFVPEHAPTSSSPSPARSWAWSVRGLVITLLAVVIWRALAISADTDDMFGRIAAAGIACWFGFQAFQNIGMCLGIMPVTGVPLPFVSYGGTSMFAVMLASACCRTSACAPRPRCRPFRCSRRPDYWSP